MSTEGLKPTRLKRKSNIGGAIINAILAACVVLCFVGVAAAVIVFWPRMTVTISDPVDSNQPFSSSITIANTGNLPLEHVYPAIALGQIIALRGGTPFSLINESPYGPAFGDDWPTRNLAMNDKMTFALNDVPTAMFNASTNQLESATMALVVNYELPVISIKCSKTYYLATSKKMNGKFYWHPGASPK